MVSPRRFRRAHISSEEEWNFPDKNYKKLECFRIIKIGLEEISLR